VMTLGLVHMLLLLTGVAIDSTMVTGVFQAIVAAASGMPSRSRYVPRTPARATETLQVTPTASVGSFRRGRMHRWGLAVPLDVGSYPNPAIQSGLSAPLLRSSVQLTGAAATHCATIGRQSGFSSRTGCWTC
jgi:hypothetical protein